MHLTFPPSIDEEGGFHGVHYSALTHDISASLLRDDDIYQDIYHLTTPETRPFVFSQDVLRIGDFAEGIQEEDEQTGGLLDAYFDQFRRLVDIIELHAIRSHPAVHPRFIQDMIVALRGQSYLYTRPNWIIHQEPADTHPSQVSQDLTIGSLSVYISSQYIILENMQQLDQMDNLRRFYVSFLMFQHQRIGFAMEPLDSRTFAEISETQMESIFRHRHDIHAYLTNNDTFPQIQLPYEWHPDL